MCVCFGVATIRMSGFYAVEGALITERPHNQTPSALRYDYKVFSAELGKRIKQLRKERGLTLRSLIVDYGFHITQIQRIERGDGIAIPTLLRLAETFRVPVGELVSGIGEIGSETAQQTPEN